MKRGTCQNGHELKSDEDYVSSWLKIGRKRCRICYAEYQKEYKRRKRRERGQIEGSWQAAKTHCPNGHSYDENTRKHKHRDCLICHREREKAKKRAAGAQPFVYRTHEERKNRGKLQRRKHQNDREARKKAQFVESVDPSVVWKRDNGKCGICGDLADNNSWHMDHKIPLSAGGEHSYANVQVSHPVCNLRKHTKIIVS